MLFEENGNVSSCSAMLLAGKYFYYGGLIMALSLIQGGADPCLLSDETYTYLTTQLTPTPSDIILPESFLQSDALATKV